MVYLTMMGVEAHLLLIFALVVAVVLNQLETMIDVEMY